MNRHLILSCESDLYDEHCLSQPVYVNRQIVIFDHTLDFRIEIRNRYAGLSDMIPAARIICDSVIDAALDFSCRNGKDISCRKGCASCCSYLVPLSTAEVFRLQTEFLLLSADERVPILKACVDAASKILHDQSHKFDCESADINTISEWYAKLNVWCPFLTHGICRIYENRPLACREYFVTSPPACCQNDTPEEPDVIHMPASIVESLGALAAQLEGSNVQAVILPLAMLNSEEFSQQRRQTWDAVKMVHLFFDKIEENIAAREEPPKFCAAM